MGGAAASSDGWSAGLPLLWRLRVQCRLSFSHTSSRRRSSMGEGTGARRSRRDQQQRVGALQEEPSAEGRGNRRWRRNHSGAATS